jgi:hypothetical protein
MPARRNREGEFDVLDDKKNATRQDYPEKAWLMAA